MRWVRPLLLILAIAGFYFLAVRPLRRAIVVKLINPLAQTEASRKPGVGLTTALTGGFEVTVRESKGRYEYFRYFMAFGEYLFVPIMLLVALRTRMNWAFILSLLHFVFFVVETGLLFLGLWGGLFFLRGMDLSSYVLFPASFGIVALAWIEARDRRKVQCRQERVDLHPEQEK